jgi:chloride channel protein, CIC family
MSVILGLASALFIKSIYYAEDVFDDVFENEYLRHMYGMLMVGISLYLMMYFFGHYYVEGVGYATVLDVLTAVLTHPGFLLWLAILKLIDTAITLGSGGSGGIFSPLLFIGATLGGSVASIMMFFFPQETAFNLQLGALVGMAGMVGASTAAPMTAIIMTAELTNDFPIILPCMIIVAVAYAVRRTLIRDSVYTLKLTRRGHSIPDKLDSEPFVMK